MENLQTKAFYHSDLPDIDRLLECISASRPSWMDDLASADTRRQSAACEAAAEDIRDELRLAEDVKLPNPFIADLYWLKASSCLGWLGRFRETPRPHNDSLSLDFIFINEAGQGDAILGKLIFERIQSLACTGSIYPALELKGVYRDADWDNALEAARCHAADHGFAVPKDSDLRWRVEISTGLNTTGQREYRALRDGEKLLGRSAGATFLLALSYHFGKQIYTDARRAFQSILALAALPDKHESNCTLHDLGGQEEKKAVALKQLQQTDPGTRRNVLLAARREHKLRSLEGCIERLASTVADIFSQLRSIVDQDRELPQALDFDHDIAEKRRGFVGREWLFEEIDLWRHEPEERALLIKGDPGTGKSSLVAQLVHANPGGQFIGYHFCHYDLPETVRPARFVQSLAAILASRLPAYREQFDQASVKEALSAKRCEASPGDAFQEGILKPLRQLQAPEGRVKYILVDALDEALAYKGGPSLVDMLASHNERFPDWLRLVATTRNDPAVLQRLSGLRAQHILASDPRNLEDLAHYLHQRLAEPSLAERLASSHVSAEVAVESISRKSSGNFLYAAQVLDSIARDFFSFANLDALPRGLDGIYLACFRRLFGQEGTEACETAYTKAKPLLQILCAAVEPLSRTELAEASGLDPEEELPALLRKLSQLLSRQVRPTGEETIAFFHKSVADWLTGSFDTNAFAVSPTKGRKRLAEFCSTALSKGRANPCWYVRRHAVEHFLEVKDWDNATGALYDLEFIEARAMAQELSAMLRDYHQATLLLPEGEKERQEEAARQAELDRYAREMVAYAAAWSRIRDGSKEKEPSLPRPVKSVRLWTGEEIAAERKRMTETPNRLDLVKAFRVFVASNTQPLQLYAAQKGFAANLARNDAPAGPVHEEGKRRLEPLQCIKLIRRFAPEVVYNPLPACTSLYEGHTADVCSVALSADGRRAISGSNDTTLCLWDLESGERVKILEGHTNWVRSVALSADGRQAISASADSTLRLWDLESSQCLKVFEGHTDWVNSIAVCVDGRISRLTKPGASGHSKGHATIVGSVALSADSGLAVSASSDNTLRVWDLKSAICIKVLNGHTDDVTSVALSADGRRAVSGSEDKTLRFWDLESGKCLKVFEGHTDWVNSVSISADGSISVSASADKTLRVWDLESGACLKVLKGHENMVGSVVLSSDARLAISGSYDSTLRVWDISSGICIKVFEGQSIWSITVAISADGSRAISANHDNNLRLWDLHRGECLKPFKGSRFVHSLDLSADGRNAISASHLNNLRLWDSQSGKCIKVLKGHAKRVCAAALSSDGSSAISWSEDQTLRVWDLKSGECIKTFGEHTCYVHSLICSHDSHRVVMVSSESIIRMWDLESGKCIKVLEGHKEWIKTFAFSSDGRRALSGSGDKTLRFWDLDSGECIRAFEGHTNWVNSVAISPDSRRALSGSADKTLRLWDLESGQCLKVFEGHTGGVSRVVLSADGHRAVSWAWDQTLRVWDLTSGECAARFFCRGLVSMAIHPTLNKIAVIFLNCRQPEFLDFENLPLGPLITTAQRVVVSEDLPAGPVSARPPCCAQLMQIPANVADRIEHWHFVGDDRGDDAYTDPALQLNCSSCGTPLRMNPFFLEMSPRSRDG